MRRPTSLPLLFLLACGGSAAQVAAPPPSPTAEAPGPAASPFVDGDVLSYRIEDGSGRWVGRLHGRYHTRDGRQEVITRLGYGRAPNPGEAPAWEKSWEYASTVRADLSPVAFKRVSSVDGRLELVFRTGFLSIVGDTATKEVPYAPDDAVVLLPDDLLLLSLTLKRQGLGLGSAGALPVRSPETGQVERWPVQVYADKERQTVARLPSGEVTLDERGRILRFTRADGLRFVLEPAAQDAPPLLSTRGGGKYERPAQASWADREVVIEAGPQPLAGTLSLPKLRGRASPDGRLPAVVLLSDLPRSDRHGFTAAYDRGTWQLLDRLAEEGFVVLRVDARDPQLTLDAAAADGRAVVAYLNRQGVVDPKRIYLLGHGFGALDALVVAKDEVLAGVVLLAPAFRAATQQGGRSSAPPYADYAKLDLVGLLKSVEEPIGVFQGMRDEDVSWREDAQALVDGANKLHRGQAKLHVFEYVDHLLKTQTGASTPASYADRGRKLDAALLDALVAWLSK